MLEVPERAGILEESHPSTQVVRGKQAAMSLIITSEVESQGHRLYWEYKYHLSQQEGINSLSIS